MVKQSIALFAALVSISAVTADSVPDSSWVKVSSFGFDPADSTEIVQKAIDSGARKLILDDCGSPWVVRPLTMRSNVELVFEDGVELVAKRGEFKGTLDVLVNCVSVSNIVIRGLGAKGGVLRMHKKDYQGSAYVKSEWRHALRLTGVENVRVENMSFLSSGGDGIVVSALKGYRLPVVDSVNVTIKNCVCDDNHRQGISVCGAKDLLIEDVVLSNTSGTLPQAGIDLEPDRPSECLSNITLRNVISKNNAGMGFEFCLTKMKSSSEPVSVVLENCVSVGNRFSVSVCGNDVRDADTVKGRITFTGCRFKDARENGIRIRGVPGNSLELAFSGCEISNAAPKRSRPDVLFEAGTSRQGVPDGIFFDGLKIIQPRARRWFLYGASSFGPLPKRVRGNVVILGPDGASSEVVLDRSWIERNMPVVGDGSIPPPHAAFPAAKEVEVFDSKPGEMVALSDITLILRSKYVFFAPAPGPVRFKMRQVPRSLADSRRQPPKLKFTVVPMHAGRCGSGSFEFPMPGFSSEVVSFDVPKRGFYLLNAVKSSSRTMIEASSVPIAVNVSVREQSILTLGPEPFPLWFVPYSSRSFTLSAASCDGYRYSLSVTDPSGRSFAKADVARGLECVDVQSADSVPGLWRVDFTPATGDESGWMNVDMYGAPGFYFLSKEKYWKPRSRVSF